MHNNTIYQGNSVISVETHPDYSHPVVIKKPSKRHPYQRNLRSLEKEYETTRLLHEVEGLQPLRENFQFRRIRDLLGDVI